MSARGPLPLLVSVLVALFAFFAPRAAEGHEFRPSTLDVTALGNGSYEVHLRPAPGQDRLQLVFPPSCTAKTTSDALAPEEGEIGGAPPRRTFLPSKERFLLECTENGPHGASITAIGLAPLRDEVLVRAHLGGGSEQTGMLTAAHPTFELSGSSRARSFGETVVSFAAAGAEHFLTGLDHVLFLAGLILLIRRTRPLLKAITAFTAAHSLTLALQATGRIHLPSAPVEATIALSVLFLARELLRPPGEATLTRKHPFIAAFAFGLLHGLGFASGLSAWKVPQSELLTALFGFNLGLEIAQLGALFVIVALTRRLSAASDRWPVWTRRAPAYTLGAAAAFWLFSRTALFWS